MKKLSKKELLQELHSHAEKFLMKNFGIVLDIPIKINSRLRSTGGRFRCQYNKNTKLSKSLDIEIAKFICENASKEKIFDILEHECIHYALFEHGKPFNDNDNYFINTCKLLNVELTHNIAKENYSYICPECGVVTEHHRKIPKGYYAKCKSCDGKIRQEDLASIKSMKVRQII